MTRPTRALLAGVVLLLGAMAGKVAVATTPDPEGTLVLLPDAISLRGQGSRQQLIVAQRVGDTYTRPGAGSFAFETSNPHVARVDASGIVSAVGDGRATITARAGAAAVSTTVEVERAAAPYPITFRNHVVPVLSKAGCNSGPCHGALAGKNGFKLTLRGYDPELDYLTLTRQAAARRINRVEPARSLMLLKPTLAVSHGGGKRFAPRSPEYGVIAQWIAAGAPAPAEGDPGMTRLEVFPASARLAVGSEQPLLVRAHFSDGHAEDVTRWVKFSTNDGAVASVDQRGTVAVNGPGEAAISGWYLSKLATARVTSPFPNPVDPAVYARAPRANFIDDLVLTKLAELNIAPSA